MFLTVGCREKASKYSWQFDRQQDSRVSRQIQTAGKAAEMNDIANTKIHVCNRLGQPIYEVIWDDLVATGENFSVEVFTYGMIGSLGFEACVQDRKDLAKSIREGRMKRKEKAR